MTLTELKAIADGATAGPWEVAPEVSYHDNFRYSLYQADWKGLLIGRLDQNGNHPADAAFIATFSPARVKQILELAEEARKALDAVMGSHGEQLHDAFEDAHKALAKFEEAGW